MALCCVLLYIYIYFLSFPFLFCACCCVCICFTGGLDSKHALVLMSIENDINQLNEPPHLSVWVFVCVCANFFHFSFWHSPRCIVGIVDAIVYFTFFLHSSLYICVCMLACNCSVFRHSLFTLLLKDLSLYCISSSTTVYNNSFKWDHFAFKSFQVQTEMLQRNEQKWKENDGKVSRLSMQSVYLNFRLLYFWLHRTKYKFGKITSEQAFDTSFSQHCCPPFVSSTNSILPYYDYSCWFKNVEKPTRK